MILTYACYFLMLAMYTTFFFFAKLFSQPEQKKTIQLLFM